MPLTHIAAPIPFLPQLCSQVSSRFLPARSRRTVRLLRIALLAWVAQNVFLVLSSLLRLELYVAQYGLTHLRMAAAIWMVVVALGLALGDLSNHQKQARQLAPWPRRAPWSGGALSRLFRQLLRHNRKT